MKQEKSLFEKVWGSMRKLSLRQYDGARIELTLCLIKCSIFIVLIQEKCSMLLVIGVALFLFYFFVGNMFIIIFSTSWPLSKVMCYKKVKKPFITLPLDETEYFVMLQFEKHSSNQVG